MQSTSICFVRSWYTGFATIWMTFVLLPWNGMGLVEGNSSFERRPRNHTISKQAVDMAQYSAPVEDLETQSCFLHFQEIKASPRKITQPVIDILVSRQPTQSASLYAVKWRAEFVGKNNPQVGDPIKYLIMWWTAARWRCQGDCINLLMIWTTYEILGLVIVR